MKYPGNINKTYTKIINYKNRGMNLEYIINEACKYYLENDIAVIYKKPTPIGVDKVDYQNGATITKAYFKEPSTLDYNGLYQGKYIEFDAKECHSKTSFPIKNVHEHQIKHIKNIIKHSGIVFLIINIEEKYYIYKGEDFIEYIENTDRKSIPFNIIKSKSEEIYYNYNKGLDYIKGINKIYHKELNINEEIKKEN